MMKTVRQIFFLLLAIALVPAVPAPAGASADPAQFIKSMGEKAINELTGPNVTEAERQERFRQLFTESFDVPTIGKFVLGRSWRTATDAERAEFLKLFEDFIVKSYAVRFADYAGESFDVQNTTGGSDGASVVHSRINRKGAETIRVDWRVQQSQDRLAITDVVVEGVSMAVTQRSEFASVIQSKGGKVAGLIDALRAKTGKTASQ
jgi:phospholipid transport system substrate-binding protein